MCVLYSSVNLVFLINVPGVANYADQNRKLLSVMSAVFLSLVRPESSLCYWMTCFWASLFGLSDSAKSKWCLHTKTGL